MLDDLSPARRIAYAVLGLFSVIALFTAFGSGDDGVDTTAPKATRSPSTTAASAVAITTLVSRTAETAGALASRRS